MQDQYLDLWYTVSIFETKTEMGLKRHNRPLDVETDVESLADLLPDMINVFWGGK